eukprot:m.42280 g.42280  ORF g.42280 m.42280 type:complete len:463 (+) comp10669_c0_seq3:338-1726(+)
MSHFKYDPVHTSAQGAKGKSAPFMGPVDIVETDNNYAFVTDCPGLSSKDVHVRVTNDLLQISGERKQQVFQEEHLFHRVERSFGRFCRTFRLPAGADVHAVHAHCEHGVLTVTIAKDPNFKDRALSMADAAAEEEGDGTLNEEFSSVPLSIFPTPALGEIVVLKSTDSILDAVRTLSDKHILSAPVRDMSQPDEASWSDKYLGMLDMVGVVFHMLESLDVGAEPVSFADEVEKVTRFRHTTIAEAVSFARFGPFVPVDKDAGTLLDCMLLCGHHAIRRVPVVTTPAGDLANIITQSALVQTLHANLSRFQNVASKTLRELGLGDKGMLFSVHVSDPLKSAFQLIKERDISGVPVLDDSGSICGNISARDVRLIVTSSKIFKLLNMPIQTYLEVVNDGVEHSAITCKPTDTLEHVIQQLVHSRIHRVYVVNEHSHPLRVVSLRNVLKKFVKEVCLSTKHSYAV